MCGWDSECNRFHEKAGRSQGNSGFIVSFFLCRREKFFSRRVATVAMLPSAISRSESFTRCMLGVHCGSPFHLCLEHVDNLGAYTASRPETGLLISSVNNMCGHPVWYLGLRCHRVLCLRSRRLAAGSRSEIQRWPSRKFNRQMPLMTLDPTLRDMDFQRRASIVNRMNH